jgi:hypothetical protein
MFYEVPVKAHVQDGTKTSLGQIGGIDAIE